MDLSVRRLRALLAGGEAYPDATRWLVTLDPSPPRRLPDTVKLGGRAQLAARRLVILTRAAP